MEHLSKVKSVQQLMADYLKKYFHTYHSVQYQDIFLVTIMQCYDKKLEGFRYKIQDQFTDIDLVLTTKEILDLINYISLIHSPSQHLLDTCQDQRIINLLVDSPNHSKYTLFHDIIYDNNDHNLLFDFQSILDATAGISRSFSF